MAVHYRPQRVNVMAVEDGVQEPKPATLGNRPANQRLFSSRFDIPRHMHNPGRYYCGKCMQHVAIPG